MVATAIVSSGVGLLIVAVSNHVPAYIGIVVPTGLWLSKLPPQRDRDMLPRNLSALLTLPFSRLYDRMGDDMQDWCDTRLRAASPKPHWISDAAQYYYNQMAGQLGEGRARADMDRWLDSIAHKTSIVRLINLDAGPGRLQVSLQMHPATQHVPKYNDDDPQRLARRLEVEALNELHLFLAYAYRLGYHKMLIYPFRPPNLRAQAQRAEPMAPDL
jgi:hypothetical protein